MLLLRRVEHFSPTASRADAGTRHPAWRAADAGTRPTRRNPPASSQSRWVSCSVSPVLDGRLGPFVALPSPLISSPRTRSEKLTRNQRRRVSYNPPSATYLLPRKYVPVPRLVQDEAGLAEGLLDRAGLGGGCFFGRGHWIISLLLGLRASGSAILPRPFAR